MMVMLTTDSVDPFSPLVFCVGVAILVAAIALAQHEREIRFHSGRLAKRLVLVTALSYNTSHFWSAALVGYNQTSTLAAKS